MLGVLLTALFSVLAAFSGHALTKKWTTGFDPAERIGVSGLVGLGFAGLATLLVGVLPNGLTYAPIVLGAALLALAAKAVSSGFAGDWRFKSSGMGLAFVASLILIGLLALVAVLAPSVSTDWDSIAYHLAVPKLWIEHGQIDFVQGIHHSNFPSTMEMLFLWGLQWGGQSGAKAFSLAVYVFGCLAAFGLARRWYRGNAGWWAALGFAGIPVVAWESGTAYIDVAHGLYAALGALYAMESARDGDKRLLVLSGVCLGLALGTKYTGLQMLFAVVLVLAIATMLKMGFKEAVRAKLVVGLVAVAIASPWYIKTAVMTGNPVYPFFYSALGGRDWDEWRAQIYSAEQKSFGVGSDPSQFGHAVLGLGYQPGRYTNPRQHEGGGFPTGAVGFAALLAGVCAATCGRLRREERLVLAVVGLGFLMWFGLSQQSRYLTMLAIPLVVLGAGQVARVRWGPVVAAAFALQAMATVYLVNAFQTDHQLEVVLGRVSEEDYLSQMLPFYPAAQEINRLPATSKTALYDEVFGFYLDRSYFWANPGHSMLIPYRELDSGHEYATEMSELGFSHVYINLGLGDRRFAEALLGVPYTQDEWSAMQEDLNTRWKLLVADAANAGRLRQVAQTRSGALYEIVR